MRRESLCIFRKVEINFLVFSIDISVLKLIHLVNFVFFVVNAAAVAQLVERVLGKDEVMGPIPISS